MLHWQFAMALSSLPPIMTQPTPLERAKFPAPAALLPCSKPNHVEPVIVGKPFAGMYELAMQRVDAQPGETLMVGDRYETDHVGAIKLGLATAGVLTGITTEAQFVQAAAG